jgi:cytochrome c peroxidase
MHDGRFNTLEEVVEHYNSGVQPHPNLDPLLHQDIPGWGFEEQDGNDNEPLPTVLPGPVDPVRMNLTEFEKNALVAFLKTLSDFELVNDPKFSDPFIYED